MSNAVLALTEQQKDIEHLINIVNNLSHLQYEYSGKVRFTLGDDAMFADAKVTWTSDGCAHVENF